MVHLNRNVIVSTDFLSHGILLGLTCLSNSLSLSLSLSLYIYIYIYIYIYKEYATEVGLSNAIEHQPTNHQVLEGFSTFFYMNQKSFLSNQFTKGNRFITLVRNRFKCSSKGDNSYSFFFFFFFCCVLTINPKRRNRNDECSFNGKKRWQILLLG